MARVRAKGTCGPEAEYTHGEDASGGVTNPALASSGSLDGIVEFVSNVFDGQHKGELLVCKFK